MKFFRKQKKGVPPPWEALFNSFGDGLIIMNPEREMIGMNPAAESITGVSAEIVLGHTLEKVFVENKMTLGELSSNFHKTGMTTLRDAPWKVRYGEEVVVDLTLTPLMSDEGDFKGWILVFRDRTPLKKLESEIKKTDRLAMMGTIAAGLAHEIKNPLGGIRGSAQLLSRQTKNEESQEYLKIIIKEVDRVDRLVGQLLTFARPQKVDFQKVDLNGLLDYIFKQQESVLEEKKIRVQRFYDPSLPMAVGDLESLQQVFLNFVKNATEAVSESGEIKVRSRFLNDFKWKGSEAGKPSYMILIEIEDNGCGISHENLEKIFTPFFTTKDKGNGLGMAIAQRIIHEHGGLIRVESREKSGTKVQVYLRSES